MPTYAEEARLDWMDSVRPALVPVHRLMVTRDVPVSPRSGAEPHPDLDGVIARSHLLEEVRELWPTARNLWAHRSRFEFGGLFGR